jgi:hypothetical protein
VFFAQGRVASGLLALLMQVSLVLWPAATRWARSAIEKSGVEKFLAELAAENHVKPDPYAQPTKKFRQLA